MYLFKKYSFSSCLFVRLMQVYPGRDITNIVESSHYQKIGGWCRQGAMNSAKCKGAQRWIKPFRCLGEYFLFAFAYFGRSSISSIAICILE